MSTGGPVFNKIIIGETLIEDGTKLTVDPSTKTVEINAQNGVWISSGSSYTKTVQIGDLPSKNIQILFYLLGYDIDSICIIPTQEELQDSDLDNLYKLHQEVFFNLKSTDTPAQRIENVKKIIEIKRQYDEIKKEFYFAKKLKGD